MKSVRQADCTNEDPGGELDVGRAPSEQEQGMMSLSEIRRVLRCFEEL